MTRQEFDRSFAATQGNTDGYSDCEIAEINDAVYATVASLDIEDLDTKTLVDHAFADAFGAFS